VTQAKTGNPTMIHLISSALLLLAGSLPAVHSLTSYANEFVDPDYILAKQFNSTTRGAQDTIAAWATDLANQGPWSVVNKSVTPPTGNKHTYMSWAPYLWPNCTGVGNTTELSPEQIWTTCPYYGRDGLFNPDVRLVNDTGAFQALSDAVLYNAIAWVTTGSSVFSRNAAHFVNTWFLDPDTAMLPNLDYAQIQRGPASQNGTHTGVLDLKGMAKIASGILILRKGNSSDWTTTLDSQMIEWTRSYITWLTTARIALEEAAATNNHGSFYFTQLAALQVLVNDNNGARATVNRYFSTLYQDQIIAGGEQPLEAARTRPYHYRAYNLAAMITNARIGSYAGGSFWDTRTKSGATIANALDYAMTKEPGAEIRYSGELYPNVAAVAAVYGDPGGRYAAFLKSKDARYPLEAYFLWDQPLSDSGLSSSLTPSHGAEAARGDAGVSWSGKHLWFWGVVCSILLIVR